MAVNDLLRDSMSAHQRAKQLRRRDKAAARTALTLARDLRLQAVEEDPEHTDPAWTDEQGQTPIGRDTHTELMAFYGEMLGGA